MQGAFLLITILFQGKTTNSSEMDVEESLTFTYIIFVDFQMVVSPTY